MPQVEANGITIEYQRHGEGEPLLLVMGLSGQLTTWPDGFVEHLVRRGFQVIRFDNRDTGLSTHHHDVPPPSIGRLLAGLLLRRPVVTAYTLDDLADDAAGLLDALGIGSAHVAGVSMGGMIAQALAIAHPQRVRSLTSIMSHTGDRRYGRMRPAVLRPWIKQRRRAVEDPIGAGVEMWRLVSGPHFDEAEAREVVEQAFARSHDPAGIRRQTAAILTCPPRTRALRRVRVPTLVVHGIVDPLVPLAGGVATTRAVRGSRLLAFPDMGHDLPRTRWAEIADAIRANASRAVRADAQP
jgi:pimeloyl-ACP methyl ester carboxylesterase